MGLIIYQFILASYRLVINLAAHFNPKAKQWVDGQAQIFNQLKSQSFHDTIWFHCASVGEFEQGYPLMERLQKDYPSSTFLVSFFSPSGYHFVKKKHPDQLITFLPLDHKKSAAAFIEIVRPKAVFFIKYEFWYHYLDILATKKIPVFLVSGIFRKNQLFFSSFGNFHRKMLQHFKHFFVQNDESKTLLNQIGLHNVSVIGDTRFDRVAQLKSLPFVDEVLETFTSKASIFMAGSVWASDEGALEKIIKNLPPDCKIIIAPHEMKNYSIKWLKEPFEHYSTFVGNGSRVLLLDTMGILSRAYRYAHIAYIGGGYGKGIHNVLEASVYGLPVLFGPNFHKFEEAKELIHQGLACSMEDADVLPWLKTLLNSPTLQRAFSQKADNYMTMRANVTNKIVVYLKEHNSMNG